MITKMKKLSLLVYHGEREKFLASLQEVGVVHIVEKPDTSSNNLQQLTSQVKANEQVIAALQKVRKEKKLTTPTSTGRSAQEICTEYEELIRSREKTEQSITSLQKDLLVLEPWGDFSTALISKLHAAGVRTRFFQISERAFSTITKSELTYSEVARTNGQIYFVVFERTADTPLEVPADEIRMPENSLGGTKEQIKQLQAERTRIDNAIVDLSQYVGALIKECNALENQLKLESARLGLDEHAEGKVLQLTGWVPCERQKGVADFLNTLPVWYSFADPAPGEDVPVVLRNRPIPKLFEPIVKLYSLPHYQELDTTPFVAPFFALFFGLCLGDIGYGILMTLGGLVGLAKVPASMKSSMKLVITLGLSTTICGLVLNSFFGAYLVGGPGVPSALIPTGASFFAPLSPIDTGKGMAFPAMSFALLVGFVQVFVGIFMQVANKWRQRGFVHTIHPLSVFVIVMGALVLGAHTNFLNLGIGKFSVGRAMIGEMLLAVPQAVGSGLLWAGLGLFFLFNNPDSKIWMRPLQGLWEMYNLITGLLSNILSYLRLFALGLAGGLLGGAFNQIAFMFVTREGAVNYASPLIVLTVLVLVIGHGINLALSAISSFAHPLRLTFVEFYGNIQFKGGSKPYVPFAKIQ